MQLRLRTKLTLIMTGLVLLVVAVLSAVFVAQLFEQVLQQTDKRALEIANQVFEQARRALAEAAERGLRPASNDPADINDYVEKAFRMSEGLNAQLKAAKLDTQTIYEVSITNNEGKVVISTVLAAVVSRATLAPLSDISAQLDRISAGQYDAPTADAKGFAGSTDELGQVRRKITQVGQQLRGVHEIF